MTKEVKLEAGRIICNPQTTSSHETATQLAWQTIAKMYQYMFFGLEEHVTVNDAKGYTKVALLVIIPIVLGGILEGGAL